MQEKTGRPTVLITGSSGFLGQAIAKGLIDRYRVIGLDVAKPKHAPAGMETIEIDLTSDESVTQALEGVRKLSGGRIASVVHLAAYYDTTGEDNPKYDAVTVQGTRRLLSALRNSARSSSSSRARCSFMLRARRRVSGSLRTRHSIRAGPIHAQRPKPNS